MQDHFPPFRYFHPENAKYKRNFVESFNRELNSSQHILFNAHINAINEIRADGAHYH